MAQKAWTDLDASVKGGERVAQRKRPLHARRERREAGRGGRQRVCLPPRTVG